MRYAEKWPEYKKQFDTMVITPYRVEEFRRYANFAVTNKGRYESVEAITGVRWYHIAVIHRRESSADFGTYLGNGQSLRHVTTVVPKGRGPFNSFEAGCIDALKIDGLTSVSDWRLEKILYYCEVFNGGGYSRIGLPSPYVWGGTNVQRPGKFIADHQFNPHEWDTQPGCAPILQMIAALDPSITFQRET